MCIRKKRSLIFAVLAAVVFIVLSIFYARYITELLTSESRMHLSEVATQGAASVQRQIARDFDMLEILADGAISKPDIPLADKMKRIKKQADKFGLFRIGLVDLNGMATTSDDQLFSVADRAFFQSAVKGKRFLSEPIVDKVDGKTLGIVYAVPVYHEDKVVNVLFSGYELEKLTERIDISFYHKSGLAFIADSSGNILLHATKERNGKNMIEVAMQSNSEHQIADLKQDLANRKSGVAHFYMKEQDRFFAYAPIIDGNDWFLFTSLPAEAVFERSEKVILLTSLLLTFVLLLLALAALYITITRKKANAKIIKLAYYDPLTGAANAERFKLDAQALFHRFGADKYALINFDIKQFRYLNNDLGHATGDRLLTHIVHCLTSCSLRGEAFARVGADQFLYLLLSNQSIDEIKRRIHLLHTQIVQWVQPSGEYHSVQMAFGVYQMTDSDESILSCIEKANIARKAVKSDDTSEIAVFNAEMQNDIEHETELVKALPLALENGEFKLFIQPKYDLLSGKIVGGEALVRWLKPDGTLLMPNDFIALFEQSSAIYLMDMHMLEQLCAFLRSALDGKLRVVPISINQSRRYMYNPSYVDLLCEKLRASAVPTALLELEVTESLVYTDLDKLIVVLDTLHEAGFRISLDDFGSGYSSLNVLKNLPVDILKLDRFMLSQTLHSEREKAIVANIIRMAKELHMSVVAEGVETHSQVLFLRECGCETAQGYYYSKPVPAEKFQQLLNAES